MINCHGKIFRRETIMILYVIELNIKKIALAGLQRFLLRFFIKFPKFKLVLISAP